jgi:hypothetical protein
MSKLIKSTSLDMLKGDAKSGSKIDVDSLESERTKKFKQKKEEIIKMAEKGN